MEVSVLVLISNFLYLLHIVWSSVCCWVLFCLMVLCMFWRSFLLFLGVLFWRIIRLSCRCLVFSCLLYVVLLFRYLDSLFKYFCISSGSSSRFGYNLKNLFFAVLYVFDLKIRFIFLTNLPSSCRILLYFFRRAFFSLNSFFNSLLRVLSFFSLCVVFSCSAFLSFVFFFYFFYFIF